MFLVTLSIEDIKIFIINSRIEGITKSAWTCVREDGRDLTNEWKTIKQKSGVKHAFVTNTEELQRVDSEDIDHLLGL